MKLTLRIVGSSKHAHLEAEGAVLRLGRDPECEISLGDKFDSVSWRHAKIVLSAKGAVLTDLESTNGTFINDKRLQGAMPIKKGDHIRLGHGGPTLEVAALDLSPSTTPAAKKKQPLPDTEPYHPEGPASTGRKLPLAILLGAAGAAAVVVLVIIGIVVLRGLASAPETNLAANKTGSAPGKPAEGGSSKGTGSGNIGTPIAAGGMQEQALAILKKNCFRCHGEKPDEFEGGFGHALDVAKMIDGKQIVPRNPDQSKLIQRLTTTKQNKLMPPVDEQPRPSADDIALLRKWIAEGVSGPGEAVASSASPKEETTPRVPVGVAAEGGDLGKRAFDILGRTCHECHGRNGSAKGGFNYVMSLPQLLSRGKIKPGKPNESPLYQKLVDPVESDRMPPPYAKERPTPEQVALIKQWIAAGAAPPADAVAIKRDFFSPERMLQEILTDLTNTHQLDRQYYRYFTLTHLYNAELSDDQLQTYRHGLSKLINSLSWGREIKVPQAIDKERTLLRIDLRDYKWTERTWDRILALNPYGIQYRTPVARQCNTMTRSALPFVRGDWFVVSASKPPLYHDILGIPQTDRELERDLLKIEVSENIRQMRVARAGFNGSGVSRNNRLLERHESTHGAYWKSYDFASNDPNQGKNLFTSPLGPVGLAERSFRQDGGEIIFNLPNGLQAYMLVDDQGRRIDTGPTNVVSDEKRPDKAVTNGISCMSCHAQGMIQKNDEIRAHVLSNTNAFSKSEENVILRLYPEKKGFDALLKEDAKRFADAVAKTGAELSSEEPIVTLVLRFEDVLDLKLAAAEAGLPADEFQRGLQRSGELARTLGVLRTPGGTVQRDAFVRSFRLMTQEMELGDFFGLR
jgi:mono/diheme cytochrome c family protein